MADDVVEATIVESKPLAIASPNAFADLRPAERVAFAVECADAVKPIIDAKKLAHHLNKQNPDDEYVELEAWQACGYLNRPPVCAKIEWCRSTGNGFEARAVVVRMDTGVEVGAGESRCTRDEWKWAKRDDYALSGMAQTRAQSRALRGVLAWILVLAGYKPTPAEEMPGFKEPPDPAQPTLLPTDRPPRAPRRRRASAADVPGEPAPAIDPERQRVYGKIFALMSEYALLSVAGKDLVAEFKDKDHRHDHDVLKRMYGKPSLHDLAPNELHDFIGKLEFRIREASEGMVTP